MSLLPTESTLADRDPVWIEVGIAAVDGALRDEMSPFFTLSAFETWSRISVLPCP